MKARRLCLYLPPVVILSGCATYSPLPLATRPDLAKGLPLTVDAHALGWPQPSAYRFDTAHGLDMTEIAILAALNNPDLKTERRKAGVARAQVFAASLLPDPQLSGGLDYPMASGVGLSNAFNVGLSYGIRELILRDTNIAAARSGAQQVDLDVLWQEWQTVQKARLLYVKVLSASQRLKLLEKTPPPLCQALCGVFRGPQTREPDPGGGGDGSLRLAGRGYQAEPGGA